MNILSTITVGFVVEAKPSDLSFPGIMSNHIKDEKEFDAVIGFIL